MNDIEGTCEEIEEHGWKLWVFSLKGEHLVTVYGKEESEALSRVKQVADSHPEIGMKVDTATLLFTTESPFDLTDAPDGFITGLCSLINDVILKVDAVRAKMQAQLARAQQESQEGTRH